MNHPWVALKTAWSFFVCFHSFVSVGLECLGQPTAQKRSEHNQPVKMTPSIWALTLQRQWTLPSLLLYIVLHWNLQLDGFVAVGDVFSCRSTCSALPSWLTFSTLLKAQNNFICLNLLLYSSYSLHLNLSNVNGFYLCRWWALSLYHSSFSSVWTAVCWVWLKLHQSMWPLWVGGFNDEHHYLLWCREKKNQSSQCPGDQSHDKLIIPAVLSSQTFTLWKFWSLDI